MISRQTRRNAEAAAAPQGAPASGGSRPGRKVAAGGALAFLVAGAVLAGGAQWTAHEVRGALAGMGVEVADVSVDPVSGIVTLDGVAASQDGVRIRIGSVESTGHFALASAAEAAGPVTLTDIEISSKTLTLRIPRIEIAGDSVDEAQLRAIFDKSSQIPLAKRLSDISFSRATLPELILIQKSPRAETTSTWKQVIISDVKNGVAGALTAENTVFSTKTGDVATTGSTGASKLEKINLALVARVYTEAAMTGADRQLQLAYGSFSTSDIKVKTDDSSLSIKNVSGTDFKARLLNTPLADILAAIEPVKDPGELEPKQRAAYFNAVADLMEAFEFGQATVTGISFDVPDINAADEDEADETANDAGKTDTKKADAGKADAGKTDASKNAGEDVAPARVRGEVASLSFSSAASAGNVQITGLKVAPVEGDLVTLGEASLAGLGTASFATIMREQAKAIEAGKDAADMSSLAAFAGNFSLKNLTVDAAGVDKPEERLKFSLQGYSGSYQDLVEGVPTNIKTSLDHLVIDLPQAAAKADDKAGTDDEKEESDDSSYDGAIRKLREMGYDKLDLSAKIDGKWDAVTKELRIGEFSFGAEKIGGLKLTGLLGNVSRELFTTGTDGAQKALMSANLKNLSLNLTNSGFAERFSELQAKDQGGDAATVRTGWAALGQMLLPSMIGTSDGAKTLTRALGAFIRTSGALDITITSKKPDGDQISEIAMSGLGGDPDKLFEMFDFKASAR